MVPAMTFSTNSDTMHIIERFSLLLEVKKTPMLEDPFIPWNKDALGIGNSW